MGSFSRISLYRLVIRLRRKPWRRYLSLIFKSIAGVLLLALVASVTLVLTYRTTNPTTTSVMLQHSWNLGSKGKQSKDIRYRWVDWEQISPYVKIAAITSEDQRFTQHNGFDFDSIQKALEDSRQGEPLRGASTITQQVAKNLFLWTNRSYIRKGLEAYFTILIELFWSKQRILEVYLNIAQFGDNVYGVDAAARTFFDVSASELTIVQSALLVTALPSPSRYDLSDPSDYMIQRRNWVIEQMFYLGYKDVLKKLSHAG